MSEGLGNIDGNLLLTFDALIRERNITRAARRLGIGQPAMSARLSRLRTLFDDPLFVAAANGRGVVATERALALAGPISSALDILQQLLANGRPFAPDETARVFTIAMHDNPAMMLAPSLVERMSVLAPSSTIVVVFADARSIDEDLESGRVDLLVGSPQLAQPQWMSRPLLKDGFLTAQRKGHPRGEGPFDLDAFCAASHLLISASGHGRSGIVDDLLAKLGRSRRVAASIQSYALAPFIIERSDLICTLPSRLLSRFAGTLDLFPPPLELAPYELRMFWHPRSQAEASHAWLRTILSEVVGSLTA